MVGHSNLIVSTFDSDFMLKKGEIILGVYRPLEFGLSHSFTLIIPNPIWEVVGGWAVGVGSKYKGKNFMGAIFAKYSLFDFEKEGIAFLCLPLVKKGELKVFTYLAGWYDAAGIKKRELFIFSSEWLYEKDYFLWTNAVLHIEYKKILFSINLLNKFEEFENNYYFGLGYIFSIKDFLYLYPNLMLGYFGSRYYNNTRILEFGSFIFDAWIKFSVK